MRYRVDPTELRTAAGSLDIVGDLVGQARERLAACSAQGWCLDESLRSDVEVAFEDLLYAARRAQARADEVARMLVAAADGYHDSNSPIPR